MRRKSRGIFTKLSDEQHAEYTQLCASVLGDLLHQFGASASRVLPTSETRRESVVAADLMRGVLWLGGDTLLECAEDLAELFDHFGYDTSHGWRLVQWLTTSTPAKELVTT